MTQAKADELIKTFEGKVNAKPDGTKNWGKSVILNFTDAPEAYLVTFAMDGKVASIVKGKYDDIKPKSVASIITTTEIMEGSWAGKINATNALMEGKIKIDGSMQAVMKLQAALM